MKKIAIEEHIVKETLGHIEERLKDMDEAGIDMQVLSYLFPIGDGARALESAAEARNGNDSLAEIVEKYPDRFVCSVLGSDRILLAVDYPGESNQAAIQAVAATPISNSEKENICHLNAEKLLRL